MHLKYLQVINLVVLRSNKEQQLNLFIKLLWETSKPTCLSTDLRLCICTSHQSWRLVASSSTALWAAMYTWLCPSLYCSTLQATRSKENSKSLIPTASLQIRTFTKESGWWEFSSKFSYLHQVLFDSKYCMKILFRTVLSIRNFKSFVKSISSQIKEFLFAEKSHSF